MGGSVPAPADTACAGREYAAVSPAGGDDTVIVTMVGQRRETFELKTKLSNVIWETPDDE